MSEANTLHTERMAGVEADRLKTDPAWKRARAHAEAEIIRQLKAVGIKDKEMQADLVRSLQLLGVLVAFIEREAETGEMARLQLEKPNPIRRMFGT